MRNLILIIFWSITAIVSPAMARQTTFPTASETRNEFDYKGLLECAECHIAPTAVDRFRKTTDFVFQNEFRNWLDDDPHARAYLSIIPDKKHFDALQTRLTKFKKFVVEETVRHTGQQPPPGIIPQWEESSNIRSLNILIRVSGSTEAEIGSLFQQMSDQPDLLVKTDVVNEHSSILVATVRQCMSCHAGLDNRINQFDFDVVRYGTGVSCEGCHGAASEWSRAHADSKWRTIAPNTKSIEHGLYNTRQAISRSKLCFSCHIGDVEQGRVVTHAMYAAGHPPLPGMEIESFADQIPRHWRHVSEKTEDFEFASEFRTLLAADLGLENESQLKQDYPRTKNLLVSGVMASAQSVDLLADSAGQFLRIKNDANQNGTAISMARIELNPWPEFAAFDCAACHHDLKTSDGEREFAGVPGRPPKPGWPGTLAKLGLAWLDQKRPGDLLNDFAASQNALQDALNSQPFGQPDELQKAGKNHSELLSGAAEQIQSSTLTRTDAIEILQLLCGTRADGGFNPEEEIRDFHSARQLGWAIRLVHSEIAEPAVVGEIRLSDQFKSSDRKIADALNELQDYLMLDLAPTGAITPLQQKFLNTWRNFDRSHFFELIERFSVALQNSGLASETNLQPTTR